MKKHSISRRDFLGVSALSTLATVTPGVALQAHAEREASPGHPRHRPNIILFMPDEMRADGLACYGNPVSRTPSFDRLASEGGRFSNCHVQFPVCGASRCSLLTGWPTSVRGHRSLYYFLRPDEPNLFRYLKQSGYEVFWYGKNDALAAECFADSVTEWDYSDGGPITAKGSGASNPWPLNDPHYYSFLYSEGGDRRDTLDYANVRAAIRILERRESTKPFCIFLPLSSPHPPYGAPRGFQDLYNPAQLPPLRPIALPRKPDFYEAIRRNYGLGQLQESDFRKIHAVYLGLVSYSDWLLGELLEAVERTNHKEDTAIFVFSDHGDYAGDYGLVEKWPSALDDVLTHVPLIARVPGTVRGHVSAEIVELYDVMATCLELAGVQARHTHFARSLMPQLHGQPGDPNRAAFSEAGYNVYEPQCFEPADRTPEQINYVKEKLEVDHPEMVSRAAMVKTRGHKLVLRPGGECELYDVAKDPRELHNVYGDKSYEGAQEALLARLLPWSVLTADVAPRDKDPRGSPPYYPTAHFEPGDWQKQLLD